MNFRHHGGGVDLYFQFVFKRKFWQSVLSDSIAESAHVFQGHRKSTSTGNVRNYEFSVDFSSEK